MGIKLTISFKSTRLELGMSEQSKLNIHLLVFDRLLDDVLKSVIAFKSKCSIFEKKKRTISGFESKEKTISSKSQYFGEVFNNYSHSALKINGQFKTVCSDQ